jgi:hypothetical protein
MARPVDARRPFDRTSRQPSSLPAGGCACAVALGLVNRGATRQSDKTDLLSHSQRISRELNGEPSGKRSCDDKHQCPHFGRGPSVTLGTSGLPLPPPEVCVSVMNARCLDRH